uniref:Uncharacterized protein n=1 Tax=Melopsittacus undulatus TaxID=13146 RepID=A0A8V5FJN9_MELUD
MWGWERRGGSLGGGSVSRAWNQRELGKGIIGVRRGYEVTVRDMGAGRGRSPEQRGGPLCRAVRTMGGLQVRVLWAPIHRGPVGRDELGCVGLKCAGGGGWGNGGLYGARMMGLDQGLPLPGAGVHRQILFTTVGWFVGYYLAKRTEYMYAKVDRELLEYVRQHPEDFRGAEKRRIGEVFEEFHPVR